MCINSLRKGECFDESCKFNHVKGTQRHPPVTLNKQTGRPVSSSTQSIKLDRPNDIHNNQNLPKAPLNANNQRQNQNQNSPNDHFLEVVRLLKADIMQMMEAKMAVFNNQIQQIQQQPYPPQFKPGLYPPNLLNTIQPQLAPQYQMQTMPQTFQQSIPTIQKTALTNQSQSVASHS